MAKLTKAQKRGIQSALDSVNRVIAFIEKDSTAICRAGQINADVPFHGDGGAGHEYRAAAPFETKHYAGRDDSQWSIEWVRTLSPMDKGIGSDLVSVYTARRTLESMLEEPAIA